MIQQCDAVDVTLDAYTANSSLTVSADGKQLRFCKDGQFFRAFYGRRFIRAPFVLGKEGFSSGRFYFEVRVSGSTHWILGVVKESINRETFCLPTPEQGGWILVKQSYLFEEEYICPSGSLSPNLLQSPKTVGVFADYEKGEVSFYDVDARTLIASYTGLTFSETTPPLKAFLYSMAGTSLSSRPKLYPVIGICGNDADNVLEITPVACPT